MNGIQEAIPYEEVAAYQANQGVSMYGTSNGEETGGFVVSWNIDTGFIGGGWNEENPLSPAFGKSPEDIQDEITTYSNLENLFENWAAKKELSERLTWVLYWMEKNPGCVY